MPNDIQVDEELVEALRWLIWEVAPSDTAAIRAFLTEHRLVRLPEKHTWEMEHTDADWDEWVEPGMAKHIVARVARESPHYTGVIRKHYHIYGPPETVTPDEEEG